jgi:hypothetical protein
MDFTAPFIGYDDPSTPYTQNTLYNNSLQFDAVGSADACNFRAQVEGRAAIGSKDAARVTIKHNYLEISHNDIFNTPTGIVMSDVMATSGYLTEIYSNNIKGCDEVGIAVRDSGNAVYRVLIHGNIIEGPMAGAASGIGVNHSYVSIYNNCISQAGGGSGGPGFTKAAAIGIRNASDAIITRNRLIRNGMAVAVLGSRVEVENNLIVENAGQTEALGVWLTDNSIGVKVNHNLIVGNQFNDGRFKGAGILVKNDSVLREARYNLIHNFQYGIQTAVENGGAIEQGAVDYNLFTVEVDSGNGTFNTNSTEEDGYLLYYWDSALGTYISDYPGPNTHYLGARFGNSSTPIFSDPGTSGSSTRNFNFNPDPGNPLLALASSTIYSVGITSDFIFSLDCNNASPIPLPTSFYNDSTIPDLTTNTDIRMVKSTPESTIPDLTTNTDIRMVKSTPEPNDTNASSASNISLYFRDTGDGILKNSIGVTVSNQGTLINNTDNPAYFSYEPSSINTSSWYKVTFEAYGPADDFPDGFTGQVAVDWNLDDALSNSNSGRYSFQVASQDDYAPFISSLTPGNGDSGVDKNVDKKPLISFHLRDTADGTTSGADQVGINPDTILVTVQGTVAGSTTSTVTTLTNANVIKNTDPADTIIAYVPPQSFEYNSTVTVNASAEDYTGNFLADDSYTFTIGNDNFAPENVQAFHVDPAGTNGAYLSWIPSVDSENDLQDQLIYYCDNWIENTQIFSCYGRGEANYNWHYWGGVGSVVDSVLVNDLPEGRYTFMLQVEDERGSLTHPDYTEDFSTDVISNGTWNYSESFYYAPAGSDAFVVDTGNQILKAYASTDPYRAGEAQIVIDDYYPGNFYFRFRFKIVGQHHGAYALLRHNIGEKNNVGGALGTSGFLAYVNHNSAGAGTGEMGIKVMPDPITINEGCQLCDIDSKLTDPIPVDVAFGANKWYEVRIAAYGETIAMELWSLVGDAKTGDPNSILGSLVAADASRYRIGELGFYEPPEALMGFCANAPSGSYTAYGDVEVQWYGEFSDDWLHIRGGYFNDDFTGFEDDFSGTLAEWTVNGNARWRTSSGQLLSNGNNGELISFGFVPQKDFKAETHVSIDDPDDKAHVLFRRQYRQVVGSSGYIAAIENNSTGSEVGFYKLTSSGLQKMLPWIENVVSTGTYTMQLDVSGNNFSLNLITGTSVVTTANATDGTHTGGMVGLYRGSGTGYQMEYDNFKLNDMISNDWITSNSLGWEVSLTESTLGSSFVLQNEQGANNAEVMIDDLILEDNFMFEGDILLSGNTGDAAAFYLQKQNDAIGESAYGLMLKINPTGATDLNNVYFFKLDTIGNVSTLKNGTTTNAAVGGFDISTNEIIHVKIVASGADMPAGGAGSYNFAAYLSNTATKPYDYQFVLAARNADSVSNLFRDGQAGFYLPKSGLEVPASVVNVDNVVIGRLEDFVIPRVGAGGTEVAIATPGSFASDGDRYKAIQDSIDNISSSVNNGDLACGEQYIKLQSGLYTLGNNILDMGRCVGLRGAGRTSTTIQGNKKIIVSFTQDSHGSSLQDLTVTAADNPKNDACIWIIDDSPLIKNVEVRNCWDGIRVGGGLHDPVNHPSRPTITASRIIYNTHIGIGNNVASEAWIENNRVFANDYNGIGVMDLAAPRIENNVIGSSAYGSGGWSEGNGNMGIAVFDNAAPDILGNSISVNNIGGIGVRGNAIPNIYNNVIASNTYGVMSYEWAEPFIYYNIIRNNSSFGNASQGSVISEVKYNEISGNLTGIAMMDDATGLIEGNYIYSNSQGAPVIKDAGIMARGGVFTSIYNNWVVDNAVRGIGFMDTPDTSNIVIRYNYIARNAASSTGTGTIGNFGLSVAGDYLYSSYGSINNGNFIVKDNVIVKNNDGGVGFTDFGGTLVFQDNVVASNTNTHTVPGGLAFRSPTNANINISNNAFYNNQGVHAGGIGVSAANVGSSITVMNNKVYWNNATATDYAISGIGFLDSLADIYINGNIVYSNSGNGTNPGIGLRWLTGMSGVEAGPIQILNNLVYSHNVPESEFAGMASQDVEGLFGQTGIGVRNISFNNSSGLLISGNTVHNNTTGIQIRGDTVWPNATGNVTISNNNVYSSRLNGIIVRGFNAKFPTFIINNNLDNSGIVSNGEFGGRTGIRVRRVDDKVYVSGNTVKNFGKGGIRFRTVTNSSAATVENNVIGSITGSGIGITTLLDGAAVSVANNLIYSSSNPNVGHGVDPDDGGMSFSTLGNNTNLLLYGNEVRNSSSTVGVGGIGFFSSIYSASASGVRVTLDNNLVWANVGSSGGGVGFTNMNAIVTMTNNSVHNNQSTSPDRGVGGVGFNESGGSVYIDNNVIYSNDSNNTLPD